jgi:hypothetical protein
MKKPWVLLLTAGLLAGSVTGLSPAQAAGGCGARQALGTLTIEMKPLKKSFKIGQWAEMAVTVTRPGPQDPAGVGVGMPPGVVPPQPVEGAVVNAGAAIGGAYLAGTIKKPTGANGKGIVRVLLEKHAKPFAPAAADVNMYAYINYPVISEAGTCVDPEEFGTLYREDAFSVKL